MEANLIDEDQREANKELVCSELEALSMTLNERELKVEGRDTKEELKLSRRPSKNEWKNCDIKSVQISIVPKTPTDKPVQFLTDEKVEYTAPSMPLLVLNIELLPTYPSHQPPKVSIKGFYERYSAILIDKLNSRWSSDVLVLYDWYSYCETELFTDQIIKATEQEECLTLK